MDQKISIRIAGRPFNLTAATPQQEEIIRLAADAINKRLESYTQRNPGKTMAELMSMVALNECACRIDFQRQLDALKADEDRLGRELGTYLDHLDK